jgi:hypothetical protein
MMIDSLARFNSLVKRSPFWAQLLEPMCQLLTQISSIKQGFQASEDQSLGHLEEHLKKPLGTFLAEVLQKAAQQKADQTPPKCPVCGHKLTRLRKVERAVQTIFGEIKITRALGRCSKCKKWFCPGDEALDVDSGYSPGLQEAAAMLASKMPLSEASAVMERLTGRKMPETTLDRVAKRAAQKARQKRQSMDEQAGLGGAALAAQRVFKLPGTLVIMMDAWNIRERDDFGQSEALRKKGLEPQRWHWVWTGTIFGLEARVQKNDRPTPKRCGRGWARSSASWSWATARCGSGPSPTGASKAPSSESTSTTSNNTCGVWPNRCMKILRNKPCGCGA